MSEVVENSEVTPSVSPIRKWGSLVILSLALAIIIIDTTILNVSLGAIIREFKTDIQSLQWVITAYSLTLAALTITGGRLGDLFGRKRMFMLGAIIFAIGSYLTSISHNVPTMIWGEAIIEGIGAALMMPATASLLVSTFRGRERAIAFGIWGGIAAASAAVGPILGGWLTTNYSWRWGFRINIFVVLLLLFGSVLINEYHNREEKPSLDWGGVFLSAFGLLGVVFGIIEASRYGWFYAKEVFSIGSRTIDLGQFSIVPLSLLIGVILLIVFMLWEARVERNGQTPLVSGHLFRNRQFTSGVLTTLVISLGQAGLFFSLPVFLQSVRSLDAFHTGLSLLPLSLSILVMAPLSAVLSHKIKPKYLIQTGLLLNVLSFFTIRAGLSVETTTRDLLPGLILFGAGMGMVMAQISNLTLSAVSVGESGEASGVNNTLRQVGQTLGSAIIGSVLLTALATNLNDNIKLSSVIPDSLKPTISQAIAEQTSNVEFGSGLTGVNQLSSDVKTEIANISHQSTVDANKRALAFGALFAILGFLVSFSLPSVIDVEREEPLSTITAANTEN